MSRDIDLQYGAIPAEIAANYKDYFPDHEDLCYEEFLLQQESVYRSYQEKGKQLSSENQLSGGQEGESSRTGSATSQEALDEAIARSLQELDEDFDNFGVTDRSSTTEVTENSVEAPPRATSQNLRQDDIDPDNMNYEELINLGETVGVEKKGLSEEVLAQLPTFKYKGGIFSKKKIEGCVICLTGYSNGNRVTSLPCGHQYHSKCINEWLLGSKECPCCKKEVQPN